MAEQIKKHQYSAREVEARIIRASEKAQQPPKTNHQHDQQKIAALEKKLKRHYRHAKLTRLEDGRIKLGFVFPNDDAIMELIDLLGTVAD